MSIMNVEKLEQWYIENQRKLVFRETNDPYLIWISEIMLQQTQVETVLPYFNRFIEKYPTVKDLALTNLEVLLKDVEGLGYYRRFKNMHLAAKIISFDYEGVFPKNYEDLLKLPGIGKYSAGAIMSIAYQKPYSALDGNVVRVLSRYFGIKDDMRQDKHKKKLDQMNQSFIEKAHPQIYTQAMMELGALLCKPKNPKCESCPLNEKCFAYHHNAVENLPYLSKLKQKKEFSYITLIIIKDQHYCLRKRTESLLNGMYEYPQFESESIEYVVNELENLGITIEVDGFIKRYQHNFTHQIWMMDVYLVQLKSGFDPLWEMIRFDQVQQIPMAVAHRKIK